MAYSMKDVRYKTREIIANIKRGQTATITERGKPIAQVIPIKKESQNSFKPIGFGMWKDNPEVKDVSKWLEKQRQARYKL